MRPRLMMSWWNCVAKEEKRQERPVTRPPVTAVRRVDLWRQRETEAGASTSDTAVHSGDSQPGTRGSVSAADDPSVSQSVFTITEKAPTLLQPSPG